MSSATILLVEDDEALRRVWRLALSLEGFAVEEAADGIEALRHVDAQPPDLVVLDLGLPRLGGLSVQQEIAAHQETVRIPVLVVTSSADDLTELKVPCVLRKPVSPEYLVAMVRSYLPPAAS